MKVVLAIIVLYKMTFDESPAVQSLRRILEENQTAAQAMQVLLFDNSPARQTSPEGFDASYFHDASNPGLAPHYNTALRHAEAAGIPWLLLLDQDTRLTHEYIAELLELLENPATGAPVAAIVPKLVENGIVQSPHRPPAYRRDLTMSTGLHGLQQEVLHVYNSGSVLRVQALLAIGGFANDFPLDYLDHVTFHALQSAGGKVLVMHAQLEHKLSGNQPSRRGDAVFLRRLYSVHNAEHAFYLRYGTRRQRIYYRIRTLRRAAGALKVGDLAQVPYFLKLALWG